VSRLVAEVAPILLVPASAIAAVARQWQPTAEESRRVEALFEATHALLPRQDFPDSRSLS